MCDRIPAMPSMRDLQRPTRDFISAIGFKNEPFTTLRLKCAKLYLGSIHCRLRTEPARGRIRRAGSRSSLLREPAPTSWRPSAGCEEVAKFGSRDAQPNRCRRFADYNETLRGRLVQDSDLHYYFDLRWPPRRAGGGQNTGTFWWHAQRPDGEQIHRLPRLHEFMHVRTDGHLVDRRAHLRPHHNRGARHKHI